MAAIDHDGGSLLHRNSRGSAGPLWHTRHIQYGPWIAVHLSGPHGVLKKAEVAISMDDKGAWRYNVLVERLGFDQIRRTIPACL